ncbi:MAG: radical SAM protein [Coriobacteriia bacterium]|nr:radical SAM protein [Coriobacteriia bacterium]
MNLLHATRALCPQCLRVLPAQIGSDEQGRVWMDRTCPVHGNTQTMVWPNVEHYRWITSLAFPKALPKTTALHPTDKPCPTGCGICQRHQRKPTLVEIEVTQRCNLRCPVCFMSASSETTDTDALPDAGQDVPLERLADFFDTIAQTAGTETGVQLTGGEPTIRKDLPQIIRMGRQCGFWGIEVNTNGLVIAHDKDYLKALVEAGLTGIYLQFDGLSPETYRQIRGADLLEAKLKAIENCREAGVQVVLAMTIISGVNSHELGAVLDFALDNVDVVAGVALQPAFTSGRFDAQRAQPLTMGDVIIMLEEQTHGLIRTNDIWPLGCSHPLCDTGTFLVPTGEIQAHGHTPATTLNHQTANINLSTYTHTYQLNNTYVPVTRDLTREEYLALYDPNSPQGSVFGDIVAKRGLSPGRGLSVIIMNYMDALTMDLERMEECSMLVTLPDGRLIPFCSYQLTDCAGRRVYPPWGMRIDEKGAVRWNSSDSEDDDE